jgi:hypothetical protein
MSSFRKIEANRRNTQLSTGPKTEEGKFRSRRNAVRHGLTAESVIVGLEDSDDYAAFELAVASDYDARTAVERELVLRLASLLWRLRRATAIESGLFKIQAQHLLQFRRVRQFPEKESTDNMYRFGIVQKNGPKPDDERSRSFENSPASNARVITRSDDLTQSFVRLSNLSSFPLDRLSRYEATLWRQACQLLLTLRCLEIARD